MAETVTVTSKGQVTLPSKLRKELKILEGEKLIIIRDADTIRIIPIPKLSKLAGADEELFKNRKPSKDIEENRKEWSREFEERTQQA